METIEVTKAQLSKELFQDVLFFRYAAPGAMGNPGTVLIVKPDGKQYRINLLRGEIGIPDIKENFPTLNACRFTTFGKNSEVPAGWHYFYLGMGNHMIVNDAVYPQFCEEMENDTSAGMKLLRWKAYAERIVNKMD